jgi:hypothetical protein
MCELDPRATSSLRDQARLGCGQRAKALFEPADLGAGVNSFEHYERLARPDDVPIAHPQLADDAPLKVLHRAPAAIGADDARRDRRASQGRNRCPADTETEHEEQRQNAPEQRPAQVGQHAARRW